MGLIVPGAIFLALAFILPLSIIDYSKVDCTDFLVGRTPIVTYLNRIMDKTTFGMFFSSWQVLVLFAAISYIVGHPIKVFSKIQYEFCTILFDKNINKFFGFIMNGFCEWQLIKKLKRNFEEAISKNSCYVWLLRTIRALLNFLMSVLAYIFGLFHHFLTFSAKDNYDESMTEETKKLIYNYFGNQADKWYKVYKFATIVIAQENLKSLSFKFLAKYNFYRSLAFIFLINQLYIVAFYKIANNLINPLGNILFVPLSIINIILWYTFHDKYKRYWTLCGNESLIALFYFLKTKRDKNDKDKKDTVS